VTLRLTVIDNYDSFTWNLVDLFSQLGARVETIANDQLDAAALCARDTDAFVVSPGPCSPHEAGVSLALFQRALVGQEHRAILGVCLGHQALAVAAGGLVERAKPMHGKTSPVRTLGGRLFAGLPREIVMARYNSLAVRADTLPAQLAVVARALDDDQVMAIEHRDLPLFGVQFHPESHLSDRGEALLSSFLRLAEQVRA
jgi:anthranilate synthase/aminodeoxychorismate synthase-like glutamine amidotransferase